MVFRCRDCSWEVLDGMCQQCSAEYNIPEDIWDPQQVKALFFDSDNTNSAAHSSDRVLAPRGNSPPPEILVEGYPNTYKTTAAMRKCYRQLRSRGATPDMCSTFKLFFETSTGIVATLTPTIKEIFSGREMSAEETWELYLGRAVQLDSDYPDGSHFVTGLLEDIFFFPGSHFTVQSKSWETIRDPSRTSVWITRPTPRLAEEIAQLEKELDEGVDIHEILDCEDEESDEDLEDQLLKDPFVESGPTLHRDEYTPTNSDAGSDEDDDDSDSDGLQEVGDLGYAFNGRYDDLNWSDGEDDGAYGSEGDEPSIPQLDPEASDYYTEAHFTSEEDEDGLAVIPE